MMGVLEIFDGCLGNICMVSWGYLMGVLEIFPWCLWYIGCVLLFDWCPRDIYDFCNWDIWWVFWRYL